MHSPPHLFLDAVVEADPSGDVTAAVTLSKDTTLRDYAQGCWRMRDLGAGHSAHLIVR